MFERYTESARRALFFARHEASEVGATSIETEHLLLGLLRAGKSPANRLFAHCGLSPNTIRKDVEAHLHVLEKSATSFEIPFSSEVKRVLERAAAEADGLLHNYIGTEHLLLAMLREERTAAGAVLIQRGLNYGTVRHQLIELIAATPGETLEAQSESKSDVYFNYVSSASSYIAERISGTPDVAVVLGSGLGGFAETLTDAVRIPYAQIPYWPTSTVIGHPGQLVVGSHGGKRVAALAGRVHLYEGHDPSLVTFGVRVLGQLGVKVLLLTNAAGGINTAFSAGALMLIEDHINLMGRNPLVGENDERFGPRFPDMTEVYSRRLRVLAEEAAAATGAPLAKGVYLAVLGPSYETPAEIRAFRTLGADAVGMSTVPEALAARHIGMEVLGISCISNMAAGVLPKPLHHDEVLETTARVRGQFTALLGGIIERL